ncbi:rhodanese-like domain-containing protein [Cyclobacterium xiamenense]|uniref:rhodanese-like domain-containing protein n=1 Tax=Cyclobacterium xiamenense TaxID=1297121 RepID=UPI0035D09097
MNGSLSRIMGFLALVFFATPVFSQSLPFRTLLKTTYDKDFPLVYPEQKELLEEAVLLDTREREEYSVSHLPGAQWVGYETFTMESVTGVSKEDTIVVYCSIGARSQEIGKKLKAAGYERVYNLYGGIFHWVNEENPVVAPDSIPTDRVHTYNKVWGIWLTKGEKVY